MEAEVKKEEIISSNPKHNLNKKDIVLNDLFRVFIVLFSSALYSLAVVWFLEPAGLVSVGMTGIGQILNKLFGYVNVNVPIGVFTFILNIPLCIYGFKTVSPRFIIYTMLSVVVMSIMLLGWIPKVDFGISSDDKLFLSIIAGLISGVGVGFALRYGTSTGGFDILAQAFSLKKHISIGFILMVLNIIIAVIYGGIMQGNWSITLYTFIFIIISNIVVDKIHTAYNYLKIEIVTKNKNLTQELMSGIQRGCTYYNVKGAYTDEDKYEVFMVISAYELEKAKKIIYDVDHDAFIMVVPIKRIIGRFFRHTIV